MLGCRGPGRERAGLQAELDAALNFALITSASSGLSSYETRVRWNRLNKSSMICSPQSMSRRYRVMALELTRS